MRSNRRLLSLVARANVILLTFGAFLVVLGIFDNLLDWNIFSQETEKFLYGMAGSVRRLADRGEVEAAGAKRTEATAGAAR